MESAAQFKLAASDSTVMLCGNPAMLDSMVAHLETKGLKEHRRKSPGQIVLERYW
jgi:ferredoxin--NADP+ reductase